MSAEKFKQRVVGVILLFIVILAAAPFIIERSHREQSKRSDLLTAAVALPDSPPVPVAMNNSAEQTINAQLAVAKKQAKAADQTLITAEVVTLAPNQGEIVKPAAKAPVVAKPVIKPHPAWVVQLGSFSALEHANKLVGELHQAGYAAYYRTAQSAKGELYRVLVGPVAEEANAKHLLKELDYRFHLQGLVLKTFDPIKD